MECTKLSEAMIVLKEALLTNDDYRLGWKANLAMAYYDETMRQGIGISHGEIHRISNKAADNFIKLLTSSYEDDAI